MTLNINSIVTSINDEKLEKISHFPKVLKMVFKHQMKKLIKECNEKNDLLYSKLDKVTSYFWEVTKWDNETLAWDNEIGKWAFDTEEEAQEFIRNNQESGVSFSCWETEEETDEYLEARKKIMENEYLWTCAEEILKEVS